MQITEIFYSIQGEGMLAGLPTVFIRSTGCNLRCRYCDTTYAYEGGTTMSIQHILDEIKQYHCSQICVTGGEPLIQKETLELLTRLQKQNYQICLETNGSQPLQPISNRDNLMISMDVKTPSSNMQNHNLLENLKELKPQDQLKFIIGTKEDYHYAKKIMSKHQLSCPVLFQPIWKTDPKDLASWILKDELPVRLGLQLHKIIWGDIPHK